MNKVMDQEQESIIIGNESSKFRFSELFEERWSMFDLMENCKLSRLWTIRTLDSILAPKPNIEPQDFTNNQTWISK